MVTCWEKADILALFCDVCVFVTFLCGILSQVWYLIVLVPDLATLFTLFFMSQPSVVGWFDSLRLSQQLCPCSDDQFNQTHFVVGKLD